MMVVTKDCTQQLHAATARSDELATTSILLTDV